MGPISEALRFDILAADKASQVFGKVADKVEDVTEELERLDKTTANPKVDVDTRKAEQKIDRFAKNLRKKVGAAVKALPDIDIGADSSDAEREIAQVRKDLLTLQDVEIHTDLDAAKAEAKLRELGARLARLNAESVDIKVKADTLAATKALSSIKLDAIKLDVDTKNAERQVGAFAADIRKRVEGAIKTLPELEITADSSDAQREIADIRNELQSLSDKEIGVDIDASDADDQLRRLKSRLDDLSGATADIRVRTDADAAARSLQDINDEVDKLDGRTAVIKVRTDRSILDSVNHITRLGAAMRAIAIPSAILAGTPALISLGGAAATAAGSMLLLPAAGNAAALAVGTLVTAFHGFGDAIGDDPEKAAEALAKLTPAAREAAQAINGLKPALADIGDAVQQTFFAELGPRIAELGTNYLPIVGDATQRVAEHFNGAATSVLQFLNHSRTVGQVKGMFSDLENTIENLAPALMPLTSIMTDVGTVGSAVLKDLTRGAEDTANSWADMVSRARESGAMEEAIRGGVAELQRFGQLAGNVGGILGAMYRAGQISGNDFLGTLIDITGRMRDFLSSAQGQTAMVGIFTGINQAVTALLPGLEAVGSAIGQIVTDKATSGALTAIATAFSDLLVAAAPTAVAISRVVTAGIQPLAAALSFLAPLIGPIVGGLLAMKAATSAMNFLAAATGLKTLGTAAATATAGLRGAGTAAAAAGTAGAAAATGITRVGAAATTAGAATTTAAGGMTRVSSALGKVQTVAGSVGRSLPLVGLAFIAADTAVQATTVSLNEAMDAYSQGGAAAEEMRAKVEAQTFAYGEGQNAVERWANGISDSVRSNLFGVATVDDFNAAIEEQNRVMHESAAATGISRSSFDLITGAMDRSKDASQQVTDSLALVGPAMAGIKDGVAPTKEMDSALAGVAAEAGKAAQAAGESATKLGGVGAGAQAAASSMQASRDAFIQTATSAGMTDAAAGALADSLGLIPATAETNFKTNAATTAMEVGQVADKLREVPVGKTVTVNAMTEPAKAALTGLGVTVTTLPDGRVEVTAETGQAQANMAAFMNGVRDQRAEVTINGKTQPAEQALSSVLAQVAAGRETINIDGNGHPARAVLAHLLGMVQGTGATIEINGNKAPAEQVVNALLTAIDTKSPTVDINGNKIPFDQVMSSLAGGAPIVKDIHGNAVPLLNVNGTAVGAIMQPATKPLVGDPAGILGANQTATGAIQTPAIKPIQGSAAGALAANQGVVGAVQAPATKPMNGNNTGGLSANELLNGAVQAPATKPIEGNNAGGIGSNNTLNGAVQAPATKPIEGNNAGGMGQNNALNGAVQAPATKPVNADTGGARGVVNGFISWVSGLVATVSVVANKIGFAAGGIYPNAEGNIVPMANGGQSRPSHFAGHRTRSMHGAAHKVPPNTWRVVGDRKTGAEAYIPITKSVRSQALLSETARRMGFDLVKAGVTEATMSAMPQVSVHVNKPAPILDVGPRMSTAGAPATGAPDSSRIHAMVDQFGAALRNTVATTRPGQPVDLRPLLSEVATLRSALIESVRGDVNIQNQFALAEMGQAAGEVARVQRTLSTLGLFH